MNTAHTPGPWNWDGNVCDYDATQEAPWLVHADKYPPILGGQIRCVNEADARLIAAAPDLLAALKLARETLGRTNQGGGYTARESWPDTFFTIDAAIAKAVQA